LVILVHKWLFCFGPLVLKTNLFISFTTKADRDQTVLQRSKPNSRSALNGEQPYPWNLLQRQDAKSRHRGAKRLCRYELLRVISLLSLKYLLFLERKFFHLKFSDHYDRLASLFDLFISQSSRLYAIVLKNSFLLNLNLPLQISVTFLEIAAPAKLNHLHFFCKQVS
jgi:hypothetical protein